jgi:hypothetical protein
MLIVNNINNYVSSIKQNKIKAGNKKGRVKTLPEPAYTVISAKCHNSVAAYVM